MSLNRIIKADALSCLDDDIVIDGMSNDDWSIDKGVTPQMLHSICK